MCIQHTDTHNTDTMAALAFSRMQQGGIIYTIVSPHNMALLQSFASTHRIQMSLFEHQTENGAEEAFFSFFFFTEFAMASFFYDYNMMKF